MFFALLLTVAAAGGYKKCYPQVDKFILVNANDYSDVGELKDGHFVVPYDFDPKAMNIRAETTCAESVRFYQHGWDNCEEYEPYSLYNDYKGQYKKAELEFHTKYTLSAVPFTGKNCSDYYGQKETITYYLKPPGAVKKCWLVNEYGEDVAPITMSHIYLDKKKFDPSKMTIRCDVKGYVKSLHFYQHGYSAYRDEEPYAIYGLNKYGKFNYGVLKWYTRYTLTVCPYSDYGGGGGVGYCKTMVWVMYPKY